MPRRLLREPHLFAHELRTPLSVLAGWISMIRDRDIDPERTPDAWATALLACQEATDRLNLIISEACDEAQALTRKYDQDRFEYLLQTTSAAITDSRRVLLQVYRDRRSRGSSLAEAAVATPDPALHQP